MPRIGMNPGRGKKSDYQPARTTVAVLTYAPNEVGYFENRLDVTHACLESIRKNTREEYDLLVFDNGSCQKLTDYLKSLKDSGEIDFLILSSRNIGKIGALKIIFEAAPGEVIAYSDDDVFFLPGWLKSHLQVLDTYPGSGLVTGFYIKSQMKYSVDSTLAFSKRKDVNTKTGNLIDPEREDHYCRQMGREKERYFGEIQGVDDVLMEFKGVPAFASAGHHQFVAYKHILQEVLPDDWSGNLMGEMRDLDAAIDRNGKLRVSTYPDSTRLLGNLIDDVMHQEMLTYGIDINSASPEQESISWKRRISRLPLIQKLAYFFYERLFKIINA